MSEIKTHNYFLQFFVCDEIIEFGIIEITFVISYDVNEIANWQKGFG